MNKSNVVNAIATFTFGFCLVFFVGSVSAYAPSTDSLKECKAVAVELHASDMVRFSTKHLELRSVYDSSQNTYYSKARRVSVSDLISVLTNCYQLEKAMSNSGRQATIGNLRSNN